MGSRGKASLSGTVRPCIAGTKSYPEQDFELVPGMSIADLIYEQVKALPDQLAREVLDFAGFVRERQERAEWRDLMDAQSNPLSSAWENDEDSVWDDV